MTTPLLAIHFHKFQISNNLSNLIQLCTSQSHLKCEKQGIRSQIRLVVCCLSCLDEIMHINENSYEYANADFAIKWFLYGTNEHISDPNETFSKNSYKIE